MASKDESLGARRRREIIDAATDLSTALGLDGLSFGRLAEAVGLTKAGVAAHFASKQALQLAVVEAAAAAYAGPLQAAESGAAPGLPRLRALAIAWLEHLDSIPYRGGCFFAAAALDFAARPGPVRDSIACQTRALLERLEAQAELADRLGELAPDVSPTRLAFQVHALAHEANLRRQLLDGADAFEQARLALDDLLRRAAATPDAHALDPSTRPPTSPASPARSETE